MKKVTDKTEFIIGIDFGHGETSADFYDLRSQEKFDLDILPGIKVIKSAVAILEQEGQQSISVGDAAIANAPYAKDFQVSFKKRPSEMNETDKNRMKAFMKGVYAGILDRHPDYKTREHVVYIARPSQDSLWKPEEKAYMALAEEAGIPIAGIQKESRAAYFRARTQPDSKIDAQVKNGVLIVDFGSSTVDFTYLNESLSSPIDDGRPLGASEVEKTLLEYALTHPSDDYMPEFAKLYGSNKGSNPYNQLLYKFREAKEAFYGKKLPVFSVSFDYGYLTSSETSPIIGFGGISIPRSQINTILGKGIKDGYIERIREAVKSFKDEKLKDNNVACVYLTGGASRMDFVREIFMEVFNLDEAHCPSDDNPSVIVSQGVAHLSYADIKAAEKETELRDIANKAIASYNWDGNLRNIINSSIKDKIIDRAKALMVSYKDGKIGEYLMIDKDNSPAGEYLGMENKNERNGYHLVHNMRGLRKKINSEFENLVHHDFISECQNTIVNGIVNSVIEKVKNTLEMFSYSKASIGELKLQGISASISSEGAKEISAKFTDPGEGHILYDAVASCYLCMSSWNLYKDRWASDRAQHYDYYRNNYANIFTSGKWQDFLKKHIRITGIDSARRQTESYLKEIVDEYVSYAKLSMFFK